MTDTILTINPGSATIKLGVFALDRGRARVLGRATLDEATSKLRVQADETRAEHVLSPEASTPVLIQQAFACLADHLPMRGLKAIGQRVVHGGDHFAGPALIDDDVLAAIEALTSLAPLHQPKSIALIDTLRRLCPNVAQIACFDTAFHRTQPDIVRRFAIPRTLFDAGVKRFGFHGLSYQFIAAELERRRPDLARNRIVAAHLGAGASICALEGGVSRDTTMGFSTLDGVPMATRCGATDPGVLLHLMRARDMSVDALEHMLYHESGLLDLSGISAAARVLAESDAASADEALEIFAFRVAREAAALASTIGGIDALVFTGGIGEHQPDMRARICARLAWLGITCDADANKAGAFNIASPGARVAVLIIPANEEQAMADQCATILGAAGQSH
ncbi:acetate kinase [Sphingobium faniae]|nr:acetate kinase [Sphingobium faniae]